MDTMPSKAQLQTVLQLWTLGALHLKSLRLQAASNYLLQQCKSDGEDLMEAMQLDMLLHSISSTHNYINGEFGPLNERSKNAGGMPCASSFDRQRDIPLPLHALRYESFHPKWSEDKEALAVSPRVTIKTCQVSWVWPSCFFFFFGWDVFFAPKTHPQKGSCRRNVRMRWHGLWSCIELWDLLFLQDAFWEPRIDRWKTQKKTSGSVKCWWFFLPNSGLLRSWLWWFFVDETFGEHTWSLHS